MRGYDCAFGSSAAEDYLPLMLYEDKKTAKEIKSTFLPASGDGGGNPFEDVTIADWSNGLGYGQPGEIPNGYHWGEFVDTRNPGMVIPAGALTEIPLGHLGMTGDSRILGDFTLEGYWYLISTRYWLRAAVGTDNWEIFHDFGSETYDGSAVVARYNDQQVAFVGRATTGFTYLDDNGILFDSSALHRFDVTPVWFTTTGGVSVRHLIASTSDYTIKKCPLSSNPMVDGNWSSEIVIGEGEFPIRSIVSAGRMVYVCTTGGIYIVNELDESLAITPYYKDLVDTENGLACRFYDKYVTFNHVLGTDAVDVSQTGYRLPEPNWITPGAEGGISNESPIWGRSTCATQDGGWYVNATFNNLDSYVIYGKPREKVGVRGFSPWVWHGAMARFQQQQISWMRTRSVSESGTRARYLYVATGPNQGSGATRLFKQSLPRSSSAKQELEALDAGSITVRHRFYPGFTLYNTPISVAPTREQTMIRVDVGSRRLGDGNSMAVSVSEDEGAYALAGSVNTSPLQAIPTTSDSPQGAQLTLKVEATGTATDPPILRSLTPRVVVDREQIELLEFDVVFYKGQPTANGGHDERASDVVHWLQLESRQNTIQTFVDPQQRTLDVLVQGGISSSLRLVEPPQGGERGWARVARVRLWVLDGYFLYDTDALYSLVARYS